MKKTTGLIALLLAALALPGHAFLGRDKVSSLWSEQPVQVDGHATEWPLMPVLEVHGMGIRAMNDASNLYLLVRATTDEGRAVMSGQFRQTLTLWFLKPDAKTKDWGMLLDFDNVSSSATAEDISNTLIPIKVLPQGLEVSTATLPSEIEFQADLTTQYGRQPIYEIRIPISMVDKKDRSLFMDLVTSPVSYLVKQEMIDARAAPAQHVKTGGASDGNSQGSAPAGGSGGGGRHRHGAGGSSGGVNTSTMQIPQPLDLQLTIQLHKDVKS